MFDDDSNPRALHSLYDFTHKMLKKKNHLQTWNQFHQHFKISISTKKVLTSNLGTQQHTDIITLENNSY